MLRRYAKSKGVDVSEMEKMINTGISKSQTSKQFSELMGYEGMGAKYYFEGLSKCVDKEFSFKGRSRRPPMDEFNSMISLGYSILMNEIYGAIETKGLNPYFGFMHRDAEKHPTLASDMMEEWRAVLVDATVMSMINGHEVQKDDFYVDVEAPGVFIGKDALKKFLNKLEKKFQTLNKYISYVDYEVSFRRAISLQIGQLVRAVESNDASIYEPIRIR